MRPSSTSGEDSMGPSDLNDHTGLPSARLRQCRFESPEPKKTLPPTMAGEDFTSAPDLKVHLSVGLVGTLASATPVSCGLRRNIGQSVAARARETAHTEI